MRSGQKHIRLLAIIRIIALSLMMVVTSMVSGHAASSLSPATIQYVFPESQSDNSPCLVSGNDSASRFAHFDIFDRGSAYFYVKMNMLTSSFERSYFYKAAREEGIYIVNKNDIHNDSVLFMTSITDIKLALSKFTDLYESTKKADLTTTNDEKSRIVAADPVIRDGKYTAQAPRLQPLVKDSVVYCTSAQVACSSNIYSFPASKNTNDIHIIAPPAVGNYPNYGCLGSQPCPAWYYMKVMQAGSITILIQQSGGLDVDFICWGPFSSVTDGCAAGLTGTCHPTPACWNNNDVNMPDGFYPRGNIVDCSFSGSATETCHIPPAAIGDFYILLITNYAGLSQQGGLITFSQTGGDGLTDCNIVVNCSVVALTTNVSSCDLTGKFSISGDVEFSNAPASGVLTVKDVTAIPPVSVDLLPPFVSPYPYTLPGINCDGSTQTITATFSNEPTCTRSETVVAPGGCPFAAMTISGDGHICNDGVSKDTLFITFSGGPPPYNFTYDIDGGIEISVTNYSGPFPWEFLTKSEGVYTLTSVSNAGCPGGFVSGSDTVTLVPVPVNPVPTAPSFSRCGTGTQPLSVSSVANVVMQWYAAVTGGTSLYSGNTFTTPSISSTTVYYVEATRTMGTRTCRSSRIPVTAEIKPVPTITNTTLAETICSGGSPGITLTGAPTTGLTFGWVTSNADGNVTNFSPSGSGNFTSEVLNTKPGIFQPGTVTYTVTPTIGTCLGTTVDFPITVNPNPTVNPLSNLVYCHGTIVNIISFAGSVPGTQYNWTNSDPSIGIPASGTGQILSFTAHNTGTSPITATITVTPAFTNAGKTCTGTLTSFTITVNPVPTVNPVISQVLCNGDLTNFINFSGSISGADYNWTNSDPTIELAASGIGQIMSFPANNAGTSPVVATITVTPSITNAGLTCSGTSAFFTITVNPGPTVNPVSNQAVCNGASTSTVTFSGSVPGGTFTWTNSDVSIGLGASGTGTIAAFTASNAGSAPVTATITVTPTFTNTGQTCTGSPTTFTITVNPIPAVNAVANQIYCHGSLVNFIHFTGSVPTAQYTWVNSDVSIGLAASGTGDILSFPAHNIGTVPVTATITITPSITNNGVTCSGASTSFTITVNPLPTVNAITSQTICNATATAAVSFSGSIPGTTYTWTNSDPSIGLGLSGTGTIPSFMATNLTNNAKIATITVSPSFTSSGTTCNGTTEIFTITVNPIPGIAASITGTATICQGGTGATYSSAVIPCATEYIWSYSGTGVSGATNSKDIVVDYSVSAISGKWNVYGRNTCGQGALMPSGYQVTVNLKPNATYTVCTPLKTIRTGRKILLKGGFPLSGTYTASEGVQVNGSGQYEFDPATVSGPFPKDVVITYRYTNSLTCYDEKTQTVTVSGTNADILSPTSMIDLRDNQQYSYTTYSAGGPMKMWMTQNLNYGNATSSLTPQTDNCNPEKYCPPSDPTCAGAGGGYYQWDELMSFQGNSGDQDLCPPGWHVPSDAEWQALIDNFDPAFPGAIANAIIGDEMKDQAKTFKAKLEGINYMNSNPAWSFTTTPAATMFWTSTPDANGKIIARGLNSPYNISISKYASSAANAFSVRCVRE